MVYKISLYVLFCMFNLLNAQSSSSTNYRVFTYDLNYNLIKQVKAQTFFIVQLELDACYDGYEVKHIYGMENFKYSSCSHKNINFKDDDKSVHKNIYKFIAKSEKKGHFTIGPFILKHKSGQTLKIPKIFMVVGDDTVKVSSLHTIEKFMVTASLQDQSLYIGQKGVLEVTFADRVYVENSTLIFPELPDIMITGLYEHTDKYIHHSNGYDYVMRKWDIEFYAKRAGNITIKDLQIKFLDERLEESSLSKKVFRRFGAMMKVERHLNIPDIYLDIKSLPFRQDAQDVQAVGQFSNLIISVNKSEVVEGQGVILTMKLYGSGNFEMIDLHSLSLPENFVYYNAETVKINDDRTCKQSEFIVQLTTQGEQEIPAQFLYYFDPLDETYKVLTSNTIPLNISADVVIQSTLEPKQDVILHVSQESEYIKFFEWLHNISMQPLYRLVIPVDSYTRLIYVLWIFFCMMLIYAYIFKKYIISYPWFRKKIVLCIAYQSCMYAQYKNNITVVYTIFLRIFIKLKIADGGSINQEFIDNYLRQKGLSDKQQIEWKNFYQQLLKASFSQDGTVESKYLFQESFKWLKILKEKL